VSHFNSDLQLSLSPIDVISINLLINQPLAEHQTIRAKLTAILHPVWHVILGSDFRLASSGTLTSEIVIKKGKLKIQCFKHTELSQGGGFLAALASSWQSLIFALACVAYLIHARVCTGERRLSLCPAEGSQIPGAVATALIVIIVLQQVNKKFPGF
jgi:hypothetical protein